MSNRVKGKWSKEEGGAVSIAPITLEVQKLWNYLYVANMDNADLWDLHSDECFPYYLWAMTLSDELRRHTYETLV